MTPPIKQIENIMSYDATSSIANIPWAAAPSSDSALRAFARRHNFSPKRTTSGRWAICWSSQHDAEQYDSAIEAIRAEVRYQRAE